MKRSLSALMALCLLLALCGCGGGGEENPVLIHDPDDPHIAAAMRTEHPDYPGVPFGEAFELTFEDPGWTYFEGKDAQGSRADVVEFSGKYTFRANNGEYVLKDVRLRFVDTSDGQGYRLESYFRNEAHMTPMDLEMFMADVFEKVHAIKNPTEPEPPTEPPAPTEPEPTEPIFDTATPSVCLGGVYELIHSQDKTLRFEFIRTEANIFTEGSFVIYYGETPGISGTFWQAGDECHSDEAYGGQYMDFRFYTVGSSLYVEIKRGGTYYDTGRYIPAIAPDGHSYSTYDLSLWDGTWTDDSGSILLTLGAVEEGVLRYTCFLDWVEEQRGEHVLITPGVRCQCSSSSDKDAELTIITLDLNLDDTVTVHLENSGVDETLTLHRQ